MILQQKPNDRRTLAKGSAMARIDIEQASHFQQRGYYLLHEQVFEPEKLEALTSILEDHLEKKGGLLSDELDTPHWRDPRLLEFLLADEVLDLVEPLVGPDIVLFSSHFISKEPYTGRTTPWHEDSYLWKELELSDYSNIVTVWLALDPSRRENGCMRVIPGTHRDGFSKHYTDADLKDNLFATELEHVDESRAVYFELEPGEASLHDGRIIHGATANISPHRRAGYTMRYFPASVRMKPEVNEHFKLWLARGSDRAGNVYER
jgi:hypothetical protein